MISDGLEAADARMYARSRCHHQRQQNLIGPRRIVHAHFHRIKMAAHVRRIDVRDGHIEPRAWTANFLGRRHNRLRAAENLAHGVAAGHVPQRAVFEFSGGSDNRALAVAFNNFRIAAQRGDE